MIKKLYVKSDDILVSCAKKLLKILYPEGGAFLELISYLMKGPIYVVVHDRACYPDYHSFVREYAPEHVNLFSKGYPTLYSKVKIINQGLHKGDGVEIYIIQDLMTKNVFVVLDECILIESQFNKAYSPNLKKRRIF